MKRVLHRRPSTAMVVAIIALVAALAGTAVAGGGFLTKKKFNKFKTHVVRGPISYVTSSASIGNTPFGSDGDPLAAACPGGTHPTGGGIKVSDEADMFVNDSYPTSTGWAGTVFNNDASAHDATITAVCAVGETSGAPAG